MIDRISLSSFKCFRNQAFDLTAVNVFTGFNGRGKSSVLQALLMLSQSVVKHNDLKQLEVNGYYVKQDLFDDIVCSEAEGRRVLIDVDGSIDGVSHSLKLTFAKRSATTGKLVGLVYDGKNFFEEAGDLSNTKEASKQGFLFNYPLESNALFKDFSYLSANRIGPTLFEEKGELETINPLGAEGQFRLNLLSGKEHLKDELSSIISYIMDGGEIVLNGEDEESPVLSFGFKRIGENNDYFKAVNCGFGYSYILSVLLQVLSSSGGALFLENPEAHLHPCAQSRLMKVICETCLKRGTQLFVETHSEHILNAVRLMSVKKESRLINKDVSLYFFDKDFSVMELHLDEFGQINPWPSGFFDQQEEDLSAILRLGVFRSE